MAYVKIGKMDPTRYVVEGHKKDMWFSAQRTKNDNGEADSIYIRDIFYNEEKCIQAVNDYNSDILKYGIKR